MALAVPTPTIYGDLSHVHLARPRDIHCAYYEKGHQENLQVSEGHVEIVSHLNEMRHCRAHLKVSSLSAPGMVPPRP